MCATGPCGSKNRHPETASVSVLISYEAKAVSGFARCHLGMRPTALLGLRPMKTALQAALALAFGPAESKRSASSIVAAACGQHAAPLYQAKLFISFNDLRLVRLS